MSSLGQRIKQRREELRLSQTAVGKKAGGLAYQTIQDLENGASKGTKHLLAIAQALGVSPQWLEKGEGPKDGPALPTASAPIHHSQQGTQDRIKVLGMAECGPDGWSLWNGEVVDTVPRPPNLVGAANAYAVFITGSSMEPRYLPGEVVHIHPGKPITLGAFVLVQIHPPHEGDSPRAVIKRLIKRTGNKWVLEQYNPPKTFTLTSDEILSAHRVVGAGEA